MSSLVEEIVPENYVFHKGKLWRINRINKSQTQRWKGEKEDWTLWKSLIGLHHHLARAIIQTLMWIIAYTYSVLLIYEISASSLSFNPIAIVFQVLVGAILLCLSCLMSQIISNNAVRSYRDNLKNKCEEGVPTAITTDKGEVLSFVEKGTQEDLSSLPNRNYRVRSLQTICGHLRQRVREIPVIKEEFAETSKSLHLAEKRKAELEKEEEIEVCLENVQKDPLAQEIENAYQQSHEEHKERPKAVETFSDLKDEEEDASSKVVSEAEKQ